MQKQFIATFSHLVSFMPDTPKSIQCTSILKETRSKHVGTARANQENQQSSVKYHGVSRPLSAAPAVPPNFYSLILISRNSSAMPTEISPVVLFVGVAEEDEEGVEIAFLGGVKAARVLLVAIGYFLGVFGKDLSLQTSVSRA